MLGAIPLAVLVALASLLTTRLEPTVVFGAMLVIGGVGSMWWGHEMDRALVPGVLAGVFPLVTVFCTTHVGYALMGDGCMPFCIGASAVGGTAAGLLVGSWGLRRHTPVSLVLVASGFGLLTGAMGSSCAGTPGLVALGGGFVVAIGGQWLRSLTRDG